jgi:hypothetical protein
MKKEVDIKLDLLVRSIGFSSLNIDPELPWNSRKNIIDN